MTYRWLIMIRRNCDFMHVVVMQEMNIGLVSDEYHHTILISYISMNEQHLLHPTPTSHNHAPIQCSCKRVWASSKSLSGDWEDLGAPCGFEWPVLNQNRMMQRQKPYHYIRLYWPACHCSNPGWGIYPQTPDKRAQAPRTPPPDGSCPHALASAQRAGTPTRDTTIARRPICI